MNEKLTGLSGGRSHGGEKCQQEEVHGEVQHTACARPKNCKIMCARLAFFNVFSRPHLILLISRVITCMMYSHTCVYNR